MFPRTFLISEVYLHSLSDVRTSLLLLLSEGGESLHYPPATVEFVIMAQPLADSAPPIRIGTFASNNKMTSLDVKRRHTFINKCLKEAGLERIMTGSDRRQSRDEIYAPALKAWYVYI